MKGERFDRWLVLGEPTGSARHPKVSCVCDCGTNRMVDVYSLRSGGTRSCGCLIGETASKLRATHGQSRVGKMTPTYRSWMLMNRRCHNEHSKEYYMYGGAGVTICERWSSFENFYADMGERPAGTTLDRIDGTRGYSPDNCRWATPAQQSLNRKSTHWIEHNGRRLCVKQWAEELGVSDNTIYRRLKGGRGVDGKGRAHG